MFERLSNSNIMYGLLTDDKIESVTPKPFLFYRNAVNLAGSEISYINDAGNAERISSVVDMPSHTLGLGSPNFSILWSNEFNPWDGQKINGTLFSNYWQDYVESIFAKGKRAFSFSGTLPVHYLNKIKLNDILKIKGELYRINEFKIDLTTGKTDFDLVNVLASNLGLFLANVSDLFFTANSQSQSLYVSNLQNLNTITKIDNGFGTGWFSVPSYGNGIVTVDVSDNIGLARTGVIYLKDTKNREIYVTIRQSRGILTIDNNTITVDNNTITVDNNF